MVFLKPLSFRTKTSISYCYFLIFALLIIYMKYVIINLILMLVKQCFCRIWIFLFISPFFFPEKSLEQSGKSVQITARTFLEGSHPIKKAEETSEAKPRENDYTGCSWKITANARTILILSPSPLVFPFLMKILKNVQFFKTLIILFH